MKSLYLLIPLSVVVLGVAVAIFFWAVRSGQYDDIDREAERILFDEDEETEANGEKQAAPENDGGTRK